MIEDKYQDLIHRVKRADINLSRAIAAKQILQTANEESTIQALDNTFEAHTASFLLSAARNELILCLRRLVEESSNRDRCSFRSLISIRSCPNLDKYIIENIFKTSDLSLHIEKISLDDVEAFRNLYSKFKKNNCEIFSNLKIFRDNHLAHTLSLRDQDVPGTHFRYSDLFKLLDDICPLFEDFTRLVRVGSFDNHSKNDTWANYSSKFWNSLSAGITADKQME